MLKHKKRNKISILLSILNNEPSAFKTGGSLTANCWRYSGEIFNDIINYFVSSTTLKSLIQIINKIIVIINPNVSAIGALNRNASTPDTLANIIAHGTIITTSLPIDTIVAYKGCPIDWKNIANTLINTDNNIVER